MRSPADIEGVPTPNVKNRTLRNRDHSFEAAKGRRGLEEGSRQNPDDSAR
jgi:hypothetical protein